MHLYMMNEPGPVLQHRTDLEGDLSEAANVQEKGYYAEEAGQVLNADARDKLPITQWDSVDTAQAERLAGALYILDGLPPAERSAVAAFVLDRTGAGFPELPVFGDIRETAALWGDAASHNELLAYALESLRRLGRVPLALDARRRLFRGLWDSFSDHDRTAFLTTVRRAS